MSIPAFLRLAIRSLMSRGASVLLTLIAIILSVSLFLGIQKIGRVAEQSFENTISGTDLIVGARSGPVNLLLYSVFRVGDPTGSVSWEAYQDVAKRREVAWTIPLSLGDSHEGFRILGTTDAYLEHYRFGDDQAIGIADGDWFKSANETVIGADVAKALGYEVGSRLTASHGLVSVDFAEHADHPLAVAGVLRPTGTPIDRTIHVSLGAIEAIHGEEVIDEPESISAFLVGLENRTSVLLLQRTINTYEPEALSAVMPGVALTQLWSVVGSVEKVFDATAAFVVTIGLLTLLITILTALQQRQREIAVLRAAGAGARHIFALLLLESATIALVGAAMGSALTAISLRALGPWLQTSYGVPASSLAFGGYDFAVVSGVVLLAILLGLIPAATAYRRTLADGLTVRL